MRVIVFDKKGLRFETDYPEPERGEHETVIRVLMAGICNTDLEIVKGYMRFHGVLGHEFVGIVESSDWSNLIGKRVVGEINCVCGTCSMCRADRSHHCTRRSVLGISGRDGAFADRLVLPAVNLHVLPDTVTDEAATFVEPLAAAFRIPEQVPIDGHVKAVVLGAGKLGNLSAQVLKLSTPHVLAIGRHREKLDLLDGLGVDTATVDEVHDVEADLVIDCTGSPDGFGMAMNLVRPEGTVVVKSTVAEQTKADITGMVVNEVTVVGSRCGPFLPALRALQDHAVEVEQLVSETFPIERAAEAFDVARGSNAMKVLIRVSP